NEEEFATLTRWAHGEGMDLTFIEVMPLGDVGEARLDQYLPLSMVRARLAEHFTLDEIDYRTGGPARYVGVQVTGGSPAFITPLPHIFSESANLVRVTCTGTLFRCLGQEDAAALRSVLRASEGNDLLYGAIDEAIPRKPKGHDFVIDRRHKRPAVARHMSVTGGGRPTPCDPGPRPAAAPIRAPAKNSIYGSNPIPGNLHPQAAQIKKHERPPTRGRVPSRFHV